MVVDSAEQKNGTGGRYRGILQIPVLPAEKRSQPQQEDDRIQAYLTRDCENFTPCLSGSGEIMRHGSTWERGRFSLPYLNTEQTEKPIVRRQPSSTPRELAERFLAGDDRAFHAIYAEHNPRLFAYCLKLVKDRATAEDLAQETWVRTIGLRVRGPEEVDNLYGMIYRIARNLALDHLKSYRETRRVDMDGSEVNRVSTSMPEQSSREEIVLRALDRLPFDYRETIVLHTYSGYSYEEIAEMLGKSPEAIWARASRGRKKLRELVTAEMQRETRSLSLLIDNRHHSRGRQTG